MNNNTRLVRCFCFSMTDRIALFLCFFLIAVFSLGITSKAYADDYQPALWFMDDLLITQVPGGNYSHAGTLNFDVVGRNNRNIKAPFDGEIVGLFPTYSGGNTVVIQSINMVQYANGSLGYMSLAFGHDNDISDCYIGRRVVQGEIFCQNGDYGNAQGVHSHVTVIAGKYTDNPGFKEMPSGNHSFANAIRPEEALFITDSTNIIDTKGISFIKYPPGPDTEKPTITKAQIGDAGPSGFYVKCSATDNRYLRYCMIGVWHSAMDVNNAVWYSASAKNNEETEIWVNYSDFPDHQASITYYVNAYAYDYAGNGSDSVRAGELLYETVPPVVTSAEITNVTPLGYDVVCTASDNSKLANIFTGTWHDWMNIDNAVWQVEPLDGNKAVIHVNIADFSYVQDVTYHTNVYARDASGNASSEAFHVSTFIKKNLSAVVGLRNVSSSGYDIVCYAVGIPDATKITIGTWHDQMHIDNAQWQTVDGSSAVFHINTSDFGNAVNVIYHTNLFFTDSSGKTRDAIRAADVMIENGHLTN